MASNAKKGKVYAYLKEYYSAVGAGDKYRKLASKARRADDKAAIKEDY